MPPLETDHGTQNETAALCQLWYEMLHGSLQFGEPTQNFIRSEPVTFVLRAEVIRATLYAGDAHKDLKAKGDLTRCGPVYDPDPTDALN